jgi:hypothetical protein
MVIEILIFERTEYEHIYKKSTYRQNVMICGAPVAELPERDTTIPE